MFDRNRILEKFATYSHDAWGGWMKYLFSQCQEKLNNGSVIIPIDLMERWKRQMQCPYHLLPEGEKRSNRVEAGKILEIIEEEIGSPEEGSSLRPVDCSDQAISEGSWDEFRSAGMLWFVNRILHVFGWVIVVEYNDALDPRVYPARTKYRGFPEESEDDGFLRVTKYMEKNAAALLEEVKE